MGGQRKHRAAYGCYAVITCGDMRYSPNESRCIFGDLRIYCPQAIYRKQNRVRIIPSNTKLQKGVVMTAHALLTADISERKDPRFVFRRRGLMTAGASTIQIKTLDVSANGFGVLASEPVHVGKTCSMSLYGVVGERVIQLSFSCQTAYCILSGVDGFRIGLRIDSAIDLHKQQLQKIIATCGPQFV
jgi:hypothetical protein